MARSRSALPGPIAIALRNMIRICGFMRFDDLAALDWAMASIPALGRRVIRPARLDPARALPGLLLFPERGAGLQIVHQELAGLERLAAMRAGHHHQDDLVRRHEAADAMHDQR